MEDCFEMLEKVREQAGRFTDLYQKMKYWMDEKEIKMSDEIVKNFSIWIEELEKECFKNDICPNCGGDEMELCKFIDETGHYLFCRDCGRRWFTND